MFRSRLIVFNSLSLKFNTFFPFLFNGYIRTPTTPILRSRGGGGHYFFFIVRCHFIRDISSRGSLFVFRSLYSVCCSILISLSEKINKLKHFGVDYWLLDVQSGWIFLMILLMCVLLCIVAFIVIFIRPSCNSKNFSPFFLLFRFQKEKRDRFSLKKKEINGLVCAFDSFSKNNAEI